jgi:hypothetical protein
MHQDAHTFSTTGSPDSRRLLRTASSIGGNAGTSSGAELVPQAARIRIVLSIAATNRLIGLLSEVGS